LKKLVLFLALAMFGLGSTFAQNLTIWTHYGEPELTWLQNEANSFGSAFGVEVEIVVVDFGEMQQQFLLSAPQGEGPDLLIGVPHDRIGELAQGGVAADMTSYATANYLEDLSEQARLAFTIGGRLFGLPQNVEGPALIVNRDLVPNLPADYDEMIAMAQALTTADTFGNTGDNADGLVTIKVTDDAGVFPRM
jgi:arabinogalactan oligomer/maltooligosaccharide transport system substrate-binding protein